MKRTRWIYLVGGILCLLLIALYCFYFRPRRIFTNLSHQISTISFYNETVDVDCDPSCYVTYKKETSDPDEIQKLTAELRSLTYSRSRPTKIYPGAETIKIEVCYSDLADPEVITIAGPESDVWTMVSFGPGQWYYLEQLIKDVLFWDLFDATTVEIYRAPVG